jgi:DNA mismatch repair protein MutS
MTGWRGSTACRRWTGSAFFGRAELAAAAGALAYVERTQISERPVLQRPEREDAGSTLFIDPATRANLEIERTLSGSRQGSLLKSIDRTVTGGGARLLAERLRSPLTDCAAINGGSIPSAFFHGRQRHPGRAAARC